MNIVLYIGTFFFYRTLNQRRDKKWNAWTPKVKDQSLAKCVGVLTIFSQEQEEYINTTTDEGNKRLDFRFVY